MINSTILLSYRIKTIFLTFMGLNYGRLDVSRDYVMCIKEVFLKEGDINFPFNEVEIIGTLAVISD